MAKLFEALKIRDVELKNRIAVSPMCQYSSEDGFANEWHMVHLGSRAVGGAGLVICEATAVSAEGRISPADLGIWKDEHMEQLSRIAAFIHSNNSVAGIQLAHAGRKASVDAPWRGNRNISVSEGGWTSVAPSAVPFREGEPAPAELDQNGIKKVVEDFKNATVRAREAGFRVVEIHAAHGYLLHEFLSTASNHRVDEYGGSFENRIRLLLEITDAVRSEWPERYPVFTRLSVSDWSHDSWTPDDSVNLAIELKNRGVDLIDCSSGGNVSGAKIEIGPLYQVPFSEKIRKGAEILTGAVGLITSAAECESVLREGRGDLIFLARQLLRDPYFPLHAAKELGVDVEWPVQYQRAKK